MLDKDGNFDGWEWLFGATVAGCVIFLTALILIQFAKALVTIFPTLF